jgi:hypothetical protein
MADNSDVRRDSRHESADLAEHLNNAKINSLSTVERSDIIRQVLASDEVDVKLLGRCGMTWPYVCRSCFGNCRRCACKRHAIW